MTPSPVGGSLLVGLGGVGGAVARYLVGAYVEDDTLDTLAVNVLGSYLLGVIVATPSVGSFDPLALTVGTGFCGAFTTFSSFAFETVRLAETGRTRSAVANAAGTLAAALVAVTLGAATVAVLV